MNLDGSGLELEEACEDRVLVAAHGDEAIELLRCDGEIPEGRDERAAGLQRREDVVEQALHHILRGEMQQRVDHADDELDRLPRMPAEVDEIRADRFDVLAAGMRLQLRKQLAVEVDGGDGETEPRKGNRLEAAAGAQVDRACRLTRRNVARREKFRVARERRVPAAVHPRIDVGEQAVVVLLDGGHGEP